MSIVTQGFGGIGIPTVGFGVGAAVEEEKKKGAGFGVRRRLPFRQFLEIINAPDQPHTQFSRAFKKAAVEQTARAEKEEFLKEEIRTGKLQGVGDLGRLSDEDLTLILLLMMD